MGWCDSQGLGPSTAHGIDSRPSVPLSHNDPGQVVHTFYWSVCASFTKQYHLTMIERGWCHKTVKVTASLMKSNGNIRPGFGLISPARCPEQWFSNFFWPQAPFTHVQLADPRTCYSKIYYIYKIPKSLCTLLFSNVSTSSVAYKLQWMASNVSVMDVLALRCTDCQFLA